MPMIFFRELSTLSGGKKLNLRTQLFHFNREEQLG